MHAPGAGLEVLSARLDRSLAGRKVLEVSGEAGDWSEAAGWPDHGRRHDALVARFCWSRVPLGRLDAFLGGAVKSVAPGALLAFLDERYVQGASAAIARRDGEGNTYVALALPDGTTGEALRNFPVEGELLRRTVRHGWGANVELVPNYWLLTFWAPRD